jgi:hypothetical protein
MGMLKTMVDAHHHWDSRVVLESSLIARSIWNLEKRYRGLVMQGKLIPDGSLSGVIDSVSQV